MKLTKETRAAIVKAALAKSTIPAMRQQNEKDLKDLARLAVAAVVKVPLSVTKLSPEDARVWLRHESDIYVRAPGYSRYDHYKSGTPRRELLSELIRLDDPVRVPVHFGAINLSDFPQLAERAAAIHAHHLETNEAEDALRAKISAIVASANTSEQLLKTWPQGKRFLPPEPTKVRALVDTKTVQDVNALLGLKA